MGIQKLNYNKNLRAALVFLNMFHLGVLEKEDIVCGDVLPVVDKNMQGIGTITFLEDSIKIDTMSDIGKINASYKPVLASVGRDIEAKDSPRYAEWKTDIRYEINRSDRETIKGLCIVTSSIDDDYGLNCAVGHSIKYFIDGVEIMSLKVRIGNEMFGLYVYEPGVSETIKVTPFSPSGHILHRLKREGKESFCKLFASILDINGQNKLMAFYENCEEGIDEKRTNYYDKESNNSSTLLIQIGKLMQENDPSMYDRIINIRASLTSGDVSLLDSFISVSLDNYDNEVIEALLGLKRKSLEYQGQLRELKNIYFGINGSFKFLN